MNAMRWSAALVVLVFGAHLPAAVSAQATDAQRDSAVAQLRTGQQVRISADGMHRLVGKAGVASNDTLDFAQDDAVRRIPIAAIDTLWVRGHATTTGLLVGGAAGAVLGGLAGAYGAGLCDYDCSETGTSVLAGSLLGAAAGAGVGALVGAVIPKWKRRYP